MTYSPGGGPLGSWPLAGAPLALPPIIEILTPSSGPVGTPGPFLEVTWSYYQEQSIPQRAYQVLLVGSGDSAGDDFTVVPWTAGDLTEVTINATSLGLPGDWEGDLVVSVRSTTDLSEGSLARYEATDSISLEFDWGRPEVEILSPPTGSVHFDDTGLDLLLAYNDPDNTNPDLTRVRMFTTGSNQLVYDSGWVSGWDTDPYTHRVTYAFMSGQEIRVEVRAANENGIVSPRDIIFLMVQIGSVTDVPPAEGVGVIYEVGIQGQGYMLYDSPEDEFQWRRSTVDITPDRLATSETPFSQAIDRYSFASQATWTGGAGQKWANRDGSDPTMFWRSDGVDPFTSPGQVRLLPQYDVELNRVLDLAIAVGGNLLLGYDSDADEYVLGGQGVGFTAFQIAAATGPPTSMAFDGTDWYVATGDGVFRQSVADGATDPGSAWSALELEEIIWAADRLIGAGADGTITVVGPDGTEETTGGLGTYGASVRLGGVVNGIFYFAVPTAVYAWRLGLDEGQNYHTPFVAWQLDPGDSIDKIGVGGDAVWVVGGSGRQRLWRCVTGQGQGLVPFLVTEWDRGTSQATIAARGNFVYFPYEEGTAVVYLPTGGWAEWFAPKAVPGSDEDWRLVSGPHFVGDGEPWFVLSEESDGSDPVLYSPTDENRVGRVYLSISDAGSGLSKVWDDVTVLSGPLPNDAAMTVFTSVDNGETYNQLGAVTGPGTTSQTFPLAVEAASLGVLVTLHTDGEVLSPQLRVVQARYHAIGAGDTILVLPVLCADNVAGLNGHPLPDSGPGAASRTARQLQALSQRRVLVQDIDYGETGTAEVYEVLQVDVRRLAGIREQAKKYQASAYVALMTLRRKGTG